MVAQIYRWSGSGTPVADLLPQFTYSNTEIFYDINADGNKVDSKNVFVIEFYNVDYKYEKISSI